jgi:hypothetical protein
VKIKIEELTQMFTDLPAGSREAQRTTEKSTYNLILEKKFSL